MIKQIIVFFLQKLKKLLADKQFGFCSKRNTAEAMTELS